MSFGKNKSKSEQTFDPELKGALLDVFGTGKQVARTPYTPYPYASIAPMSPTELAGMQATADTARAGVGQDQVNQAINTANRLTNATPSTVNAGATSASFTPTQITGQAVNARQMGMDRINPLATLSPEQVSSQGINAQQVGQTGPVGTQNVQAEDITAGQFSQTNLTPYQNQYEQGVVDTALGDIERARQMQQNENAASAVSAGAFGGSRQGLVEAETNRAALQQSADTAARLRQQGFESAAQRAESDIGRRMQADQMNTQFGLQGDLANQQAGLQSGLAAQGQNTQRALANQQANLAADTTSAANNLRAQQLNQAAGLQAGSTNIANELARLQSNQGMRGQMEQAQTQANLSAAQSNAANNLRRQQLNQAANMDAARMDYAQRAANVDRNLQGQLANQQAGLQNAQQQLGAAQQLANLGQGLRGMQFADAGQLTGVGQQQRQFGQQMLDDRRARFYEQQEYPFRMFDVLRGAAGILPNPLTSSSYGRGFNVGLPT
jgi:hypothetical protein